MTADPRDTARQWLAERYERAWAACYHDPHPCVDCVADAVLSAPGVEVWSDPLSIRLPPHLAAALFDEPAGEGEAP